MGLEYHVTKPHNIGPSKTMPPKKAAARGRGPANRVTKPGHATNRSGARPAAATDAKNAGRPSGPGRGRSTKGTTVTEIADSQPPVDEPAAQLSKTKPGRGRRKAVAPEEDDGGGMDQLSDPIADLEPEPPEPVRGRRGRAKKKQSAVDPTIAIPETQALPDPTAVSTHDETDRMEEGTPPSVSTGPTSIVRQANTSFSVSRPPPPTREHGTAMADASLRRRLGELTQKYDSLEQKYRDLREIGVKEAELNFDKLKKQSDERANSELRCGLALCLIYALAYTLHHMQLPTGWWPR